MEFEKFDFQGQNLSEISAVIQDGLCENFEESSVKIIQCPDLRNEPFFMASEGLGGKTAIADVGGPPYLLPVVQREKIYNLDEIIKIIELPGAFLLGAGAGPFHRLGVNSEMIPNYKAASPNAPEVNNSHVCRTVDNDSNYNLKKLDDNKDMGLLANLFASNGTTGPVLEVRAKKRTGEKNFISCIRESLQEHYKDVPVGMGGVFLLKEGKAKIHVMPDFCSKPVETEKEVNEWLKFFNMSAPLICESVFISHDPNLDLRVEHTHCFSTHGDGGHYHYDVTPEEVEYHGYFNLADTLYRIDRPTNTNQLGRD